MVVLIWNSKVELQVEEINLVRTYQFHEIYHFHIILLKKQGNIEIQIDYFLLSSTEIVFLPSSNRVDNEKTTQNNYLPLDFIVSLYNFPHF